MSVANLGLQVPGGRHGAARSILLRGGQMIEAMGGSTVKVPEPITGERAEYLWDAQDNRGNPGHFSYWRGPNGHVFLHPAPDDMSPYYAGGYQRIPADEDELAEAAKEDAYRLDHIVELVPSGTFLEVGSWIGLTAYSAKVTGYQVCVLERDNQCVNLMRRSGIEAIQTSDPARTLGDMDRTFDVIGLWHSIEHLPRPWEVIAEAAKRVRPGGVLVISAPNPESAQFRLLGRHWVHLDAPRHVHFLPLHLIQSIAEAHGLVVVEKTSDDKLGAMLDEHGWRWELHRRVRRIFGIRALAYRLFWRSLQKRHRTPGAIDGASYTLTMMRPTEPT